MSAVLPRSFDNRYRGQRIGLWLFVPVLLMKTAIALGTLFGGRMAAQLADGIPLASFGAAGAQAVVTMFGIWGLAQLVFTVFGVLALARYRSMIPLMYVLLTLEHLARRWLLLVRPIARTGTPPGLFINLALLALMVAGLALSLWTRKGAPPEP